MRNAKGQFVKGIPARNKTEYIQKTCPTCGTQFSVKPSLDRVVCCSRRCASTGRSSGMKGKVTPPEVRAKQRAAKLGLRGSDHWNWRGGKRSERKIAMARDEYIQWRKAVFARDDYTCRHCDVRGVKMHADHILPWATHPDQRYEIDNGRTLCVPCHHQTPTFPAKLIPKEMRSG